MRLARWLLAAASLAVAALPTQAQNYPTRPIRLISPFAAGGANDVLARAIGIKLGDRLGAAVVIENRPGAGAVLGLVAAARSAPDGYTLVLSGSTLAVTGTLYKKPPFDATKDFAPVALVVHYPFLLVATKSLPANSIPELVGFAREHPGKLLYASPGVATSQHLFAELFKVTTGTDLVHIPYNGTSPAVVDIVAGRVSLMFAAAAPSLPLIRDGSLKVLGVSSAERLAEAPDIPPIVDSVPGFDVSNWSIILAPAGTPREIVNKLHAELKAVMAAPDVKQQLAKIGMIAIDSPSPEQLETFVSSEVTRWGKIVQQAGIAGSH
jgi:tripartite-type tricarboxylate transporter receptor subunit TctC